MGNRMRTRARFRLVGKDQVIMRKVLVVFFLLLLLLIPFRQQLFFATAKWGIESYCRKVLKCELGFATFQLKNGTWVIEKPALSTLGIAAEQLTIQPTFSFLSWSGTLHCHLDGLHLQQHPLRAFISQVEGKDLLRFPLSSRFSVALEATLDIADGATLLSLANPSATLYSEMTFAKPQTIELSCLIDGHSLLRGSFSLGKIPLDCLKMPLFSLGEKLFLNGFAQLRGDFNAEKISFYCAIDELFAEHSQLSFSEITATLILKEKALQLCDGEGFVEGIYFSAASANLHSDSPSTLALDFSLPTMNGTLFQVKPLLAKLAIPFPHPLEGDISLIKKGASFNVLLEQTATSWQVNGFEAHLQGTVTEASLPSLGATSLQDLSFNFEYDHSKQLLDISDIQGSLFVGVPDALDEYLLGGNTCFHCLPEEHKVTFDLWAGDKTRDILRLVGTLSPQVNSDGEEVIAFSFDQQMSHFGDVHPDALQLTLKDWQTLSSFHLQFHCRLATLFCDLKRLSRTGLFFLSQATLKALHEIESAAGDINVSLDYGAKEQQFNYRAAARALALNDRHFNILALNGKRTKEHWSIDHLQIDDFSLSAEMSRATDSRATDNWHIDFLGINYRKALLMGLVGEFFPKDNRVDAKLNLLEIDLQQLDELLALQELLDFFPRGKFRATGTLQMAFFNGKQWWQVDAIAKGRHVEGKKEEEWPVIAFHLNPLEWSAYTRYQLQKETLDLGMRLDFTTKNRGELFATAHTTDTAFLETPLTLRWQRNAEGKVAITELVGHLAGIDIALSDKEIARETIASSATHSMLYGTLVADFSVLQTLLPSSWQQRIEAWGPGKELFFKGLWQLPYDLIHDLFSFQGSCQGEQWEIKGSIQGTPFSSHSVKGEGELRLKASQKDHTFALLTLPLEAINHLGIDTLLLNPSSGSIFYEIKNDKIFLTKFKDVYSEGKLSKFYLAKESPSSYLDFDGNLHLHIKMKQYNPLFKLAELLTFNIRGNIQKPLCILDK